jgi:hypothetical protein
LEIQADCLSVGSRLCSRRLIAYGPDPRSRLENCAALRSFRLV